MAQFANETLSGQDPESAVFDWPGGPGVFAAIGTFSGVSLQLRFSLDGTAFADVPGADMTMTEDGMGSFQIGPCKLQVVGTGGAVGTDVDVRVVPSWQGWWNDPNELPSP